MLEESWNIIWPSFVELQLCENCNLRRDIFIGGEQISVFSAKCDYASLPIEPASQTQKCLATSANRVPKPI